MEQSDERYLNSVQQYNKDREFGYKNYTDALERNYREKEFEDAKDKRLSEEKYLYDKLYSDEKENALDRALKAEENEKENKQLLIENALKKWDTLGYLDSESAMILGLSEGLHTSDYDYKKAQQYRLYNK